MDENFKKKIVEDFGLGGLQGEAQEKMIERIGNMLFEAVIERSIDMMDEDSLNGFEDTVGAAGADYQKVIGYLASHVQGFQGIVSDELARLKRATSGIFA